MQLDRIARTRSNNTGGQRQGRGQRNADGNDGQTENRLTPSTAPVVAGQNRLVWVLGQDGKPQTRRITVGLSDGSATEIVSGNLQEGDVVIIGETVSGQPRTQTTQTAPGFGGGQRGGFGGGKKVSMSDMLQLVVELRASLESQTDKLKRIGHKAYRT